MLGNRKYCYPLTIGDYSSLYLLACEALESTREPLALTTLERVFREYGLPNAIRTDNGFPFALPTAISGLSRLSVWLVRPRNSEHLT
jgi:putative transposase